MIERVISVAPTKSGKAYRVKLGNDYYNAFLDSGIEKMVGKVIDVQITPDKGYGLGIGQFTVVEAPVGQVTAPKAPAPSPAAAGATAGAYVDRWWINFVSNCCGQGIAHGVIKSPSEIGAWAKAAREAIEAVDSL